MIHPFQTAPYLFLGLGASCFLLGLPNIREATVGRLQKRNILPVVKLKPKYREVLLSTGPDLSLMIVGAALFVLGIILLIA